MKCPKCGLENRPDARFCKQCGQSLPTQPPTHPTHLASPSIICPACGATSKPHRIETTRARFCPRCGKPLPTDPTQPSPSTADTIPAMPSVSQSYTTPAPATQPPTYTQPPVQPPPPPITPERSRPRWTRWIVALVALICVAALIQAAVILGPKLLGGREEPTPTSTTTASPTAETSPTTSPTSVSEATLTPTTEAVPAFNAKVTITAAATELHIGDPLIITVTITNTGQVPFGSLRYQLLGEWDPFLQAPTGAEAGHEVDVAPAGSDTATFILEAAQAGTAQIHANVTVDTREESPSTRPVSSEYIVEVSVIQ